MTNVAINGLGRIGRAALKVAIQPPGRHWEAEQHPIAQNIPSARVCVARSTRGGRYP
jgi:glyceraldehyde-3-phosphate dehydrogenase/erythrose-4-phosphate dehydrogenase